MSLILALLGVGHPQAGGAQAGGGQVEASGELVGWVASLPVDTRVSRELQRFQIDKGLSPELGDRFSKEIRSRVSSAAGSGVSTLLGGECVPSLDVSIGESEFPDLEEVADSEGVRDAWKEFRGSLIRTEMVACLTTSRGSAETLQLYVSPDFRMKAESRITRMWTDPEGSCIETKGAYGLVDPTLACNRIHDYVADGIAAQHSQVVFNEGEERYQVAYFKESLKTFVKTQDGLALHYVNYTRAADLGRLERWIGGGKIEDSQRNTVEELQRWLATGNPSLP